MKKIKCFLLMVFLICATMCFTSHALASDLSCSYHVDFPNGDIENSDYAKYFNSIFGTDYIEKYKKGLCDSMEFTKGLMSYNPQVLNDQFSDQCLANLKASSIELSFKYSNKIKNPKMTFTFLPESDFVEKGFGAKSKVVVNPFASMAPSGLSDGCPDVVVGYFTGNNRKLGIDRNEIYIADFYFIERKATDQKMDYGIPIYPNRISYFVDVVKNKFNVSGNEFYYDGKYNNIVLDNGNEYPIFFFKESSGKTILSGEACINTQNDSSIVSEFEKLDNIINSYDYLKYIINWGQDNPKAFDECFNSLVDGKITCNEINDEQFTKAAESFYVDTSLDEFKRYVNVADNYKKLLVDCGANASYNQDGENWLKLYEAAKLKRVEIISILLKSLNNDEFYDAKSELDFKSYFENKQEECLAANNNSNQCDPCKIYDNEYTNDVATACNKILNEEVNAVSNYVYSEIGNSCGGNSTCMKQRCQTILSDLSDECPNIMSGNTEKQKALKKSILSGIYDYIKPSTVEIKDVCKLFLSGSLNKYINLVLNIIRIGGPILIIFLTAYDGMQYIISGKEEGIKKFGNNLKIRIICLVLLFLVPTIVKFLVGFLNQTICVPK